jgi:hypothetical protein
MSQFWTLLGETLVKMCCVLGVLLFLFVTTGMVQSRRSHPIVNILGAVFLMLGFAVMLVLVKMHVVS